MMEQGLAQVVQKLGSGEQSPVAPATDSPKDRKRRKSDSGCVLTSVPLAAMVDLGSARETSETA